MQNWPAQEAKANFSELLDDCLSDCPQLLSRRGTEVAVLTSLSEWERLQSTAKPSLKSLLLNPDGRTDDLLIPKRGNKVRRKLQH